jgi:hypothetical protein
MSLLCSDIDQMSLLSLVTARFVAPKHKRFGVPRLKHEKPNYIDI